MGIIRILFLADTHLGFDCAFRPQIERRRRGPQFFANVERALQPALEGRVDCVVHGGDILYRSKVPARLVAMAFKPLKMAAAMGVKIGILSGPVPEGPCGAHHRLF
jgi:DNA repair protein SbcD/Mre11